MEKLRDRSKIKKPDFYKVEEQELEDDISVDSDWDDNNEIDKISIKSDNEKSVGLNSKRLSTGIKDSDYEYDDFVVPDTEGNEIDTECSDTESEFSDSIESQED